MVSSDFRGNPAPSIVDARGTIAATAGGNYRRFRALGADASGIVSDVMDELGITGVIGASVLKPTMVGQSIVGPALTARNIMQREHVYEAARRHVNKMAEFEAHNLALAGDIVVIEGVAGISNTGGISAQTGKRQGEAGAVVFGGVRDVGHSRRVADPVWATEITPVTGKWRIETVEINGEIVIGGVRGIRRYRARRRYRRLLYSARPHRRGLGASATKIRSRRS